MKENTPMKSHFEEAAELLGRILQDDAFLESVEGSGALLVGALERGGKVISCGNGGSMCDAMHFAEELSGRYREDRKPFPAIACSDPSHMSCVGNDYGFDYVFSRFVEAVGREGDVLLAISTSGNSKNVLEAARVARNLGMKVIGLTGKDGGALAPWCDVEVRVPHDGYADRIQEIHIKVIHTLIDAVEQALC